MTVKYKYIGKEVIQPLAFISWESIDRYQECDFCSKIEKGNTFWGKGHLHMCPDCVKGGKKFPTAEELRQKEEEEREKQMQEEITMLMNSGLSNDEAKLIVDKRYSALNKKGEKEGKKEKKKRVIHFSPEHLKRMGERVRRVNEYLRQGYSRKEAWKKVSLETKKVN